MRCGPRSPVSGPTRRTTPRIACPSDHRTTRQRRGAAAEALVANRLRAAGWRMLASNLRVGRDEIDLLAVDPGPPAALVVVEVRSLRSRLFGAPEERVDRAKVGRLYRALGALRSPGAGDTNIEIPTGLGGRVDLVVVDSRSGRTDVRHLRALEPP
jgi:putative endonuclease